MVDTLKELSFGLTLLLNTIVLISAVLRVSSVVYSLKQSIVEARTSAASSLSDITARIDKDIIGVLRQIDAVEHSIKMIGMEIAGIHEKIETHNENNEKSREILSKEMHGDLKDAENVLKDLAARIRDIENFTQKVHPEFHIRG